MSQKTFLDMYFKILGTLIKNSRQKANLFPL